MTLDQWIALLTPALAALVVVGGGVGAYWWQKKIDRKEELKKARQEAYINYLNSIHKKAALQGVKKDSENTLHDKYLSAEIDALIEMQITFPVVMTVAPDNVSKVVGSFNSYFYKPSKERNADEFMRLFSDMIIKMRGDINPSSKLTCNDIASLWPIDQTVNKNLKKSSEEPNK